MKKKIIIISLIIIVLLIIIPLPFLAKKTLKALDIQQLANKVSITLPKNAAITKIQDTTGFHGDGVKIYKVSLNQKQLKSIEKQVKTSWNKGKLSDEIDNVIYLGLDVKEYEKKYKEKILLPKINNGYWFLKSEHNKSLEEDSSDFYLGVYDKENGLLYLYESHS